jgi:hypothetical protein
MRLGAWACSHAMRGHTQAKLCCIQRTTGLLGAVHGLANHGQELQVPLGASCCQPLPGKQSGVPGAYALSPHMCIAGMWHPHHQG